MFWGRNHYSAGNSGKPTVRPPTLLGISGRLQSVQGAGLFYSIPDHCIIEVVNTGHGRIYGGGGGLVITDALVKEGAPSGADLGFSRGGIFKKNRKFCRSFLGPIN